MKHGRYEILERLGEGESAIVYRTRDLARGGREVAVKVLKKAGERDAAGFRHEFAALAALRHPNLISVIDFGVSEDGLLYYSSDFQPGQKTLGDAVPGRVGVDEAIDLALPILRGLEYVHTRGLLHRDLKPANVLVGEQGDVRLADFGLSGAAEGQVAGTPHYMAPEVLRRVRLDRRCDLYSFGVLLFELLTGQLPFDGNATEVARAHLESPPPSPRDVREDLPAALSEVVQRLLAKEPSGRYPSANAVIAALAEATGRELDFETADTKEAYVLSGRFVARDRELDWLGEAFRRAVGPLEWERDPREFDRRERFATHRAAKDGKGERRRGGDRRASRGGALNPPALMVFVRGESGLGKTRLVDELRRRTQLEGAVFLGGGCSKHQARGFEPFVSVIQEAAQLSGNEEDLERHGWAVQRLLAQNGDAKGVERLRLIDALAEFLIAQASRRPLVIALDDLQWARGETLELLLHLYRTLVTIVAGAKSEEERPQLFLVGTYRPDEMHGPDLGRALRDLKRDRFFEELLLRPFSGDDVAELIRSMLGVPNAPRAFVERVMGESAGNPLFVELLMEELVARGVVDRTRGLWRLDPERLRALEVPGRVNDLVFSWLERLPHRELLQWLAVLDRASTPNAIAELTGDSLLGVQGALDDLVGRRVVRRVAAGYELAHAKVRDAVYEAIEDRPALHAAVARTLEEGLDAGHESGSLGEVAHHQLEAGLGLDAIRWARRAGDAAASLGARERACELYSRAQNVADELLTLHRDDVERVHELREAKLGLLRAHVHELTLRERVLEARSLTLEGLDLARVLGDAQAEVSALAHLGNLNALLKEVDDAKRYFFEALKTAERIEYGKGIGASLLGLGDLTLEEGRLDEALAYLERSLQFEQDLGDGREVSSYLRALANAQRQKGNLERALEAANRALDQDQSGSDAPGELSTLELLADVHFLREDYPASIAAGEQGLALAERLGDKAAFTRCALALGSAHERSGDRVEARRRLREAAALARRLGLASELAQALNGLGWLNHVEASYEEALCAFNEATTIWNTRGDREGYALGLGNLGLCYGRQGLLERAGSCYDAAVRVGWETSNRLAELAGAVGRARVHALTGEVSRAREQLDKTVLRARELRLPRLEARALAELGQLLARDGEGGRALRACQRGRTLASEAGDPTVEAEVILRSAQADLTRGALAPALEATRGRTDWLRAAADRALEIESELVHGAVLTAVGDFVGAGSSLDEAAREAERRGLAPLLAATRLAQGELLLVRALVGAAYRPGRVVLGSAELGEARAHFEASRALASDAGASALASSARLGLARVALVEGELDRAREQAEQVLADIPHDDVALGTEARLLLAEAAACDKGSDEALALLDELAPLSPRQRLRRASFRALACQRAERRIEARASLEDAAAALDELQVGLEPTDRRLLESLPALEELRSQLAEARADAAARPTDDAGEALRARPQRALGFLRAARDVQQASPDTQQRLLVDRALALFGAQRGYLAQIDPAGEVVVLEARLAMGKDAPAAERQLSSSVVTHVAQAGEVLVMPDAQHDMRLGERPSVVDLQLRSVLAAPLRIAGRVRYVLVLEDRDSLGRFGDADRELAESLAELLAFALDHTQLQQQGQQQTTELAARASEIQRLNSALEVKVAEQTEELDSVKAALKGREYDLGLQSSFHNLIGRSEPMVRVFRLLERVADSDVPVLIQGESGTGKELVARAIHFTSGRKDKPCLSINCGAMPESLLESELFGHLKGAFTGADRNRQGLFEAVDGGTLFLDEVGDMPAPMQSKLLRVLQEGEVRPVGSQKPRQVNVRIVSASNKDLRQLVDEGLFRADLFYRLNVVSLGLPPLRERKDDIPLLVDHLLDKIAERSGKKRKSLERKVVDHLLHHDWPGNVRELENELRRLVALSGQRITERDLSPHIRQAGPTSRLEIKVPGEETPLKRRMEAVERQILVESLRRNENNKTRTAKLLGLSRYGFLKKLDKYGLREER